MTKMKIAFWIIPIGFLALVGYQNKAFFQETRSLSVNLAFTAYDTPQLQIWIFFLVLFVFGILLTYLFGLPGKFRAGKSIKTLNAAVSSQRSELTSLKNEVAAMRNPVPAEPAANAPLPGDGEKVEPRE